MSATLDVDKGEGRRKSADWLAGLRQRIPILSPALVFIVIFSIGGLLYRNFFSLGVLLNLFTDNAFLGVAAVGMTFVIISGGIDLSVGAVISTSAMIIAVVDQAGAGPLVGIPLALAFGASLGCLLGLIIHFFRAHPFIVTLSGMFLARGLGYVLSWQSVPIENEFYAQASQIGIPMGGILKLSVPAIMFIGVVIIGIIVQRATKYGRNIYAIGGNETSAFLMGLPVGRTKILIYTVSGLLSALGGVVLSFYTLQGYGNAAFGLELEAIASVVIGGTLLTGGVGSVLGTLIGVLILGLIQTFISFQGTLNVYWTRIFIGMMLFAFILLQKALSLGAVRRQK
ncbi:MAG: sugar ABC transporter permease YjfF [Spirochaetales bacterium]|nr:sugar ABC transporter permease YjfF [Spirochaetales bacterium]